MKWLLDFFYCRSWREFFVLAVLASDGVHCILGATDLCLCTIWIGVYT
jgi:hypothetical protein